MDTKDFSNLGRGDIVRHKRNRSTSYVVDVNHGGSITAMATVNMTNPDEWELVLKCTYADTKTVPTNPNSPINPAKLLS